METKLFKQAFVLLFVVAFLHVVSVKFYLYWTIWWIDMPIHFLAGVCIGVVSIMFYCRKKQYSDVNKTNIILISVLFAIIVGLLWEIFELYFNITSFSEGIYYVTDTSSDLIMDITGGISGSLYGLRYLKNS